MDGQVKHLLYGYLADIKRGKLGYLILFLFEEVDFFVCTADSVNGAGPDYSSHLVLVLIIQIFEAYRRDEGSFYC